MGKIWPQFILYSRQREEGKTFLKWQAKCVFIPCLLDVNVGMSMWIPFGEWGGIREAL